MTNRGAISVGIGAVVGLALGAAPRAVFTEGTGVTFLPALIGLAVGAYLGWAADRRGRALAVAVGGGADGVPGGGPALDIRGTHREDHELARQGYQVARRRLARPRRRGLGRARSLPRRLPHDTHGVAGPIVSTHRTPPLPRV